ASTAGREAALHLAFELGGSSAEPGGPFSEPGGPSAEPGGLLGGGPIVVVGPSSGPGTSVASLPVPGGEGMLGARLGAISGTSLDLIASLVTLTVAPGGPEGEFNSAGGTGLLAVFAPGGATGFGQGLRAGGDDEGGAGEPEAEPVEAQTSGSRLDD